QLERTASLHLPDAHGGPGVDARRLRDRRVRWSREHRDPPRTGRGDRGRARSAARGGRRLASPPAPAPAPGGAPAGPGAGGGGGGRGGEGEQKKTHRTPPGVGGGGRGRRRGGGPGG